MKNDFSIQLSADDSKLISALNNSKNKLEKLQTSFEKAGSKTTAFGSKTESLGKQLEGLSGQFEGLFSKVGGSMEGLSGMFSSLGGGISSSVTEMLGSLGMLGGAFAALGAAVVGVVSKSLASWDNLKQELNAFQNIAEVSDAEMMKFAQSAKELSNQSGIATIEIIKMQQGLIGINPDLAKNTTALNTMSRAVLALSAAGRISSEDAGQYLSSVLAAFNLSGESAVETSNKIAQASRLGSQEINNVSQILQKSGSAFASAGVDLNMALGVIEGVGDKYLGKSEELGTALNSTLSRLMSVREEYSEYNLSLHSLNDVLETCAKNHLTYADYVELVGIANASLLKNLVENRQKFGELAAQIDGTNAALEMAEVQNNSLGKSWEKLGVVTENFWLTLSQSAPMQELYSYIQDVIDGISDLLSWFEGLCDQWNTLIGGFESSFTIWDYLKAQMQVSIFLIKSLGEFFVVACAMAIKPLIDLWHTCRDFATEIWKKFSDFPLGRAVQNAVKSAWQWLQDLGRKIAKWWNDLKKSLGLKPDNSTEVKVNVKEDKTITQTFKGGGSGLPAIGGKKSGSKKGGSKKHGSGSKKTEIAAPEIGSLAYYEQRLRAINEELSKTRPNAGRLQELKMESAVVTEMIDKLKRHNKLFDEKPKHSTQKAIVQSGSIQDISDQISKKESQIKNVRVGSDEFNLLVQEIEELKEKKEFLELKMHPKVDENSMNSLLGSLAKVQEQINGLKYEVSITTDKSKLELLREQIDFLTNKEHTIQLKVDEKKQAAITQNADDIKTKYENLGQAAQSVGSVFNALGDVTNDSFLSMVGTISGAVANILPEISKLIVANEASALSSGTASAAALPFPLNIVSIGTVIASILSIFSSLPKFETGGVVGGHSFSGDKVLARLNSGELVLNKNQQNRLYSAIQQGHTSTNAPMNGSVQFKISGRDLIGVLSNQQNKTSRVL
nr:MAG TPA: Putative tail length tape measure protein [Caudoviricetes sp.]